MIATQQELIETFAALPPEAQRQALNFIAFLHQTHQKTVTDLSNITAKDSDITVQHQNLLLPNKFAPHSAEAKAISRLPDQDDPSKWITSIEEDEPIDEPALNAWLEKKGYQKANV
jgi:hypothetical protein